MHKLSKFKPMMAMCSQGQRRSGVDEGSLFMYNRIFRDICEAKPYVVQNNQFNKIDGYQQTYNICYKLSKTGPFMCIGGDHSVAAPSVLASLQRHPNLNVLWVDAHPDIHTYKSSESGNSHGMPVSAITGLEKQHFSSRMSMKTLPFDRLTYIGIRDIDDFEAKMIEENNIRSLNTEETLRHIHKLDGPIHISFDIDSIDPAYVTSTGTPVPGGLSPEDVEAIFEECLKLDKLVSCDVVEFNGELGDPEPSIKAVKSVFKQCF
jgi:arginase